MKLKKLLPLVGVMGIATMTAASADVIHNISEIKLNNTQKSITVSGTVPVSSDGDIVKSAVTLNVFKAGVGIDNDGKLDLSEIEKYGNGSTIEYTNQTVADASGKYSFTFTMAGNTDSYLIRIGYNNAESHGDKIYKYVNPHDALEFIEDVGTAYDAKATSLLDAKDKLLALIEKYYNRGYLKIDCYESVKDRTDKMDLISEYILSKNKPGNDEGFIKLFEEGYTLAILDHAEKEEAEAFFTDDTAQKIIMLDETFVNAFLSNPQDVKDDVFNLFATASQKGVTVEVLKHDIYNKIVLSELDSYLWQANYEVIKKYNSILNVSFTDYDALESQAKRDAAMKEFVKTVADIDDIDEIKGAFAASVGNAKNVTQTEKSSDSREKKSSGGGGGGVSVVTAISNVNPKETLNQQVDKPEQNDEKQDEITQTVQSYYDDLEDVKWAEDAIVTLTEKGIVKGYGNNKFLPKKYVTREEFVKMIISALDLNGSVSNVSFEDVTPDKWYYEYVSKVLYYELIKGVDDKHFGVGKSIKRADVAVIFSRILDMYGKEYTMKDIVYSDVLKDEIGYAYEAIYTVSEAKLMNGTSAAKFEPLRGITRAEAAVVTDRLMKLLENN